MVQETSIRAYFDKVMPHIGEKQAEVLEVFINASANLTNWEVAKILGWSINRVTPRVWELREEYGLLKLSEIRKCNVTENTAMAWTVDTDGIKRTPLRKLRRLKRIPLPDFRNGFMLNKATMIKADSALGQTATRKNMYGEAEQAELIVFVNCVEMCLKNGKIQGLVKHDKLALWAENIINPVFG